MPEHVELFVGGITVAFVIFAVALAWADHYAHGYPPQGHK